MLHFIVIFVLGVFENHGMNESRNLVRFFRVNELVYVDE